ncbi:signal peptidase II [Companilactobacillus metriopterae]|uniref:signal peptidase II n=1 Tax=Companilactobacillus metriopterae TaxID=1909267 RepID=UPI00100BB356|nr:signal peptidase II [Companilactobacillus metriopterae]
MPVFYFLFVIILVILDQLLKLYISGNIPLGSFHNFIPGVISIANIRNDGAAWSMLEGQRLFFIVVTLVAIIVLCYLIYKSKFQDKLYVFSLLLLLSGTIGNGIDRLINSYVTDMFALDFINFPIFNLADSYITVGVILLVCSLLFTSAGEEK